LKPGKRQSKVPLRAHEDHGEGILLSLVSGVLMGSFFPLVEMGKSGPLGLGPYAIGFVFAAGVLLSTFVFNLFFMNLPIQGQPVEVLDYIRRGNRAASAWHCGRSDLGYRYHCQLRGRKCAGKRAGRPGHQLRHWAGCDHGERALGFACLERIRRRRAAHALAGRGHADPLRLRPVPGVDCAVVRARRHWDSSHPPTRIYFFSKIAMYWLPLT
jgi:hypothetical protein